MLQQRHIGRAAETAANIGCRALTSAAGFLVWLPGYAGRRGWARTSDPSSTRETQLAGCAASGGYCTEPHALRKPRGPWRRRRSSARVAVSDSGERRR